MPPRLPIVLGTVVVLIAFAGNSILCRLALGSGRIDPYGFTALRLASGALVLAPFLRWRELGRSWRTALTLALYALGFSLAYVTLPAGTGALLLFGTVQATMIGGGWLAGERLGGVRALGIGVALVGLVLLVLPGVEAPDTLGALWMVAAGVGWGLYSLLGRAQGEPTRATAGAFTLATPLALLALVSAWDEAHFGREGVLLAVASGALTSGLGYALWYRVLRGHSRTSAAVVQLAVPVLAATGGVLFLGEALSVRLVGAGALTLGGVAMALVARERR